MSEPASALIAVFGWRDAVLLDDPTGVGAELQAEARAWSWEKIERKADAWAADQLVGLAEYLPKLMGALEEDRLLDAAAIRADLARRLGEVGAVVHRVTSESENGLWQAVAEAGGSECARS